MAKATSMADQPGSAPAGDPPKTQDAPAAATVAASDAPAGLPAAPAAPAATVDDVAALRAQLAEATANTDAKIQAAVAAAVGAALAGISHPAKPSDDAATVDQLLAKMDRERKEREEAKSKIDAWLESGPLKFDISMTNEPRMNRRVGGVSQDEAQAKYMRFFGITAIVDPGKRINVTAVS